MVIVQTIHLIFKIRLLISLEYIKLIYKFLIEEL